MTDVACGAIFVLALVVWIGIEIYGIAQGDFARSYAPLDSSKKFCGFDSGYDDYPNLYFTKIEGSLDDMYKSAICVKECPDLNSVGTELACKPIPGFPCPSTYFKSKNVWRTCIPDETAFKAGTPGYLAMQKFNDTVKKSGAGADALKEFLWEMIVCSCLAVILNILFIYFMSKFPMLLGKISVALIEILMLFSLILYIYLGT